MLAGDSTIAASGYLEAEQDWGTILFAKFTKDAHIGIGELLESVFWSGHGVNQLFFRCLAHHSFSPHLVVLQHLHRLYTRIGATKAVEDSNNLVARLPKASGQKHEQGGGRRIFAELTDGLVFGKRNIDHVKVEREHYYQPAPTPPKKWSDIYNPRQELPEECNSMFNESKNYTAPSPLAGRTAITAMCALTLLRCSGKLDQSDLCWQACCLRQGRFRVEGFGFV